MIEDPKLKRFCDSFPSQWLQLERIISSVPNREKFPGFYMSKYRHSMHMMLEPLLLFEAVLIENMPLTQLIDSDFTYRSPLLSRVYGTTGEAKAVVDNWQAFTSADRSRRQVSLQPGGLDDDIGHKTNHHEEHGYLRCSTPPPADVPLKEKPS